jgi:hypothetical protein
VPPPDIRVTVTPDTANVHVNRSVQLTATVLNSQNSAVTWSVSDAGCSDATCGTVSSTGLYTAPANVPSYPHVRIKVTAVADTTKTAYAWITILAAVELMVTPPDPTVAVDLTLQFTAHIGNALDSSANWTVLGSGCTGSECGTISTTGLYTAPSVVPDVPVITITATSVEDPATSASATAIIALSCVSIEWAWISGSKYVRQSGSYGTQGIPDPSNVPGAREGAVSWLDPQGNLWLFGGFGLATNMLDSLLNDLWKYDLAAGEWTWVSGPNIANQQGSYGTRGIPDPSNVPGARYDAVSWLDPNGNLWLFGGYGFYPAGWACGNDLWKFDPSSHQWTWVSGNNIGDQPGFYGIKGLADPANIPGARRGALSWLDPSGDFWLIGGRGYDSTGSSGDLNDLWMYSLATNEWTWVSGNDLVGQLGVYGTKGTADPSNIPGARSRPVSWIDLSGNLWLFGGTGPDYDHFNDLWKFDPASHQWTWISGSNTAGQAGVYGTKGIADSSSVPGGRSTPISWLDPIGNLWLFGGAGYDSTGENTALNDLWMFSLARLEWTWVSGSKTGLQQGFFGIKGIADSSNVPGARYWAASWIDTLGNFWLFGGWACDGYGGFSYLNDLWRGIR